MSSRGMLAVGISVLAMGMIEAEPLRRNDRPAVNLLGRGLTQWSRSDSGATPWRSTADGGLACVPTKEALVMERIFADGTLVVEYRFAVTAAKSAPRASIGLRMEEGLQGGYRIALGEGAGSIQAKIVASSDREKDVSSPADPAAKSKPIGEWNTLEISCKGSEVAVRLNGVPATNSASINSSKGLLAIIAEGSSFEIRRLNWQSAE